MIKDDDKGNKVCFMEKYFILVSLNKEEGRKIVCWFIFYCCIKFCYWLELKFYVFGVMYWGCVIMV